MKRLPVISLAAIFLTAILISAAGCGNKNKTEKVLIGILKMSSDPFAGAVEKGIQDELRDEGYTEITYNLQNARGSTSTAHYAAKKFSAKKAKFAVGIGIQASRVLKKDLKGEIIIYSAVTDPVDAGLIEGSDAVKRNIAGVSDKMLFKPRIEYFNEISPITKLAYIYPSGKADIAADAKKAADVCRELDIEFIDTAVKNPEELKKALRALAGRADAIYICADKTLAAAYKAVSEFAVKSKIPVFSSDAAYAEKYGFLAAWGVDYYKAGRETGKVIARIISGELPGDIPVTYITDPLDADTFLNLDVAERLEISIDDDIIEETARVVKKIAPEKK